MKGKGKPALPTRGYFLDNTFPPNFAAMLRALKKDVQHLRERDGWETGDVADIDWIPSIAKADLIAVSGDRRILSRPAEREVRELHRLRLVVFHGGFPNLAFWDQAIYVVRVWPAIENATLICGAGACFETTAAGKVQAVR